MILLEHDAKTLLRRYGVSVPPGVLVDAADIAEGALPPGPWVVKAQVPTGGRGKAGAIRFCEAPSEIPAAVEALLRQTVKGHPVRACLVEARVPHDLEAYVSLSIDPPSGRVRLLLSTEGGVDVEAQAEHPGAMMSVLCELSLEGLLGAVEEATLAVPPAQAGPLRAAAEALAKAFLETRASLLEVNPLFIRHNPAGRSSWVAGDVKLVIDAASLESVPQHAALIRSRADLYPEAAIKLDKGFDYIELDPAGEIGLLTTGAGLSMMIIDEMARRNVVPLNFCDVRTGQLVGDPARLVDVIGWICAAPRARVILINVFAGITDLVSFARLLDRALGAALKPGIRVVARLIGDGFDEARAHLEASGHPIEVHRSLDAALEQLEVGRRRQAI